MICTIRFKDTTAFTSKDLKESLSNLLGENMEYKVEPADNSPEGIISFGLNELVAHDVLDIYFNEGRFSHKVKIEDLKQKTMKVVADHLDDVIEELIFKLEEK